MKALVEGVELTERELLKVLEKHGVKKFSPQGEKFDPNLHQAMYEVPTSELPPGHVAQVIQAGYMLGDRVLRPAMVAVVKAAPKASAASANDNPARPARSRLADIALKFAGARRVRTRSVSYRRTNLYSGNSVSRAKASSKLIGRSIVRSRTYHVAATACHREQVTRGSLLAAAIVAMSARGREDKEKPPNRSGSRTR